MLSSKKVSDDLKESLRLQYQELDPVFLLQEMGRRQDQFWQYAWNNTAAALIDSIPPPAADREPTVRVEAREDRPVRDASTKRAYRRTRKPSVPHTWRTRVDPSEDVWRQVRILLEIDPSRTAKQMFEDVQSRHPGRSTDGQLRTLQRRLEGWRREHLYSDAAIREGFRSDLFARERDDHGGEAIQVKSPGIVTAPGE